MILKFYFQLLKQFYYNLKFFNTILLQLWWKMQRHNFAHKGPYSQSYGFSSSHVWMWEVDHKEGSVPKNCFQIVMLEKTLESILDSKEIKLVNPKGNQLWILTGRTEAEASILWSPDVKNWLIGKDPDAGKGWSKRRRGQRIDG